MLVGIDPKVDFAFKWLFGDPRNLSITKNLVNSTLKDSGLRSLVNLEIVNPFNLKETPTDKMSILDIKAKDETGRQLNLEMQVLLHQGLRPRVVYYLTRLHSTQLHEGQNYHTLCPSISMLFINEILFPETSRVHNRFLLSDLESGLIFSDQIEIHVIELPKLMKSDLELSSDLEQWIYFFVNAKGLDMNALPGGLTVPEIKKALSELTRMSGTREEQIRYIEREIALRDLLTWKEDVAKAQEDLAAAQQEAAAAQQEAAAAQQEATVAQQEATAAQQEVAALRSAIQDNNRRAEELMISKGRLIGQIQELERARQLQPMSIAHLLTLSEDQLRDVYDRIQSPGEEIP